jgi:hypothetical protein
MPAPLEPAAITGDGPEPIAETPSDAEYRRIRKTVRFFVLFGPFFVVFVPFLVVFGRFLTVFGRFWTVFFRFLCFLTRFSSFLDRFFPIFVLVLPIFGQFLCGFNSESVPIKFWSVFSSGEVINIWNLYSLYNLIIRLSLNMADFDVILHYFYTIFQRFFLFVAGWPDGQVLRGGCGQEKAAI